MPQELTGSTPLLGTFWLKKEFNEGDNFILHAWLNSFFEYGLSSLQVNTPPNSIAPSTPLVLSSSSSPSPSPHEVSVVSLYNTNTLVSNHLTRLLGMIIATTGLYSTLVREPAQTLLIDVPFGRNSSSKEEEISVNNTHIPVLVTIIETRRTYFVTLLRTISSSSSSSLLSVPPNVPQLASYSAVLSDSLALYYTKQLFVWSITLTGSILFSSYPSWPDRVYSILDHLSQFLAYKIRYYQPVVPLAAHYPLTSSLSLSLYVPSIITLPSFSLPSETLLTRLLPFLRTEDRKIITHSSTQSTSLLRTNSTAPRTSNVPDPMASESVSIPPLSRPGGLSSSSSSLSTSSSSLSRRNVPNPKGLVRNKYKQSVPEPQRKGSKASLKENIISSIPPTIPKIIPPNVSSVYQQYENYIDNKYRILYERINQSLSRMPMNTLQCGHIVCYLGFSDPYLRCLGSFDDDSMMIGLPSSLSIIGISSASSSYVSSSGPTIGAVLSRIRLAHFTSSATTSGIPSTKRSMSSSSATYTFQTSLGYDIDTISTDPSSVRYSNSNNLLTTLIKANIVNLPLNDDQTTNGSIREYGVYTYPLLTVKFPISHILPPMESSSSSSTTKVSFSCPDTVYFTISFRQPVVPLQDTNTNTPVETDGISSCFLLDPDHDQRKILETIVIEFLSQHIVKDEFLVALIKNST